MSINIDALFQHLMEDPDIIPPDGEDKEDIALAIATQRAKQSSNNTKALSMAKEDSIVSKLLAFLKADEDAPDAAEREEFIKVFGRHMYNFNLHRGKLESAEKQGEEPRWETRKQGEEAAAKSEKRKVKTIDRPDELSSKGAKHKKEWEDAHAFLTDHMPARVREHENTLEAIREGQDVEVEDEEDEAAVEETATDQREGVVERRDRIERGKREAEAAKVASMGKEEKAAYRKEQLAAIEAEDAKEASRVRKPVEDAVRQQVGDISDDGEDIDAPFHPSKFGDTTQGQRTYNRITTHYSKDYLEAALDWYTRAEGDKGAEDGDSLPGHGIKNSGENHIKIDHKAEGSIDEHEIDSMLNEYSKALEEGQRLQTSPEAPAPTRASVQPTRTDQENYEKALDGHLDRLLSKYTEPEKGDETTRGGSRKLRDRRDKPEAAKDFDAIRADWEKKGLQDKVNNGDITNIEYYDELETFIRQNLGTHNKHYADRKVHITPEKIPDRPVTPNLPDQGVQAKIIETATGDTPLWNPDRVAQIDQVVEEESKKIIDGSGTAKGKKDAVTALSEFTEEAAKQVSGDAPGTPLGGPGSKNWKPPTEAEINESVVSGTVDNVEDGTASPADLEEAAKLIGGNDEKVAQDLERLNVPKSQQPVSYQAKKLLSQNGFDPNGEDVSKVRNAADAREYIKQNTPEPAHVTANRERESAAASQRVQADRNREHKDIVAKLRNANTTNHDEVVSELHAMGERHSPGGGGDAAVQRALDDLESIADPNPAGPANNTDMHRALGGTPKEKASLKERVADARREAEEQVEKLKAEAEEATRNVEAAEAAVKTAEASSAADIPDEPIVDEESTSAVQQLTERQKKEPKPGQQPLGLRRGRGEAAQPQAVTPAQAAALAEDTPERQPEGEQRSFEDYEAEEAAAAASAETEEPPSDEPPSGGAASDEREIPPQQGIQGKFEQTDEDAAATEEEGEPTPAVDPRQGRLPGFEEELEKPPSDTIEDDKAIRDQKQAALDDHQQKFDENTAAQRKNRLDIIVSQSKLNIMRENQKDLDPGEGPLSDDAKAAFEELKRENAAHSKLLEERQKIEQTTSELEAAKKQIEDAGGDPTEETSEETPTPEPESQPAEEVAPTPEPEPADEEPVGVETPKPERAPRGVKRDEQIPLGLPKPGMAEKRAPKAMPQTVEERRVQDKEDKEAAMTQDEKEDAAEVERQRRVEAGEPPEPDKQVGPRAGATLAQAAKEREAKQVKKDFLLDNNMTPEHLGSLTDEGLDKEFNKLHETKSRKSMADKQAGKLNKEEIFKIMAKAHEKEGDDEYLDTLRERYQLYTPDELVKKHKEVEEKKATSKFEHQRNDAISSALNMSELPEEGTDKLHAMDRARDIAKRMNDSNRAVQRGGEPLLDSNSMKHLKALLDDANDKGDLSTEEFNSIAEEVQSMGEKFYDADHKASIDSTNDKQRANHEEFLGHMEDKKRLGHDLDHSKAHEQHHYSVNDDGTVGERTGSSHSYRDDDGAVQHVDASAGDMPDSEHGAVKGMDSKHPPKLLGLSKEETALQAEHFKLMKKGVSTDDMGQAVLLSEEEMQQFKDIEDKIPALANPEYKGQLLGSERHQLTGKDGEAKMGAMGIPKEAQDAAAESSCRPPAGGMHPGAEKGWNPATHRWADKEYLEGLQGQLGPGEASYHPEGLHANAVDADGNSLSHLDQDASGNVQGVMVTPTGVHPVNPSKGIRSADAGNVTSADTLGHHLADHPGGKVDSKTMSAMGFDESEKHTSKGQVRGRWDPKTLTDFGDTPGMEMVKPVLGKLGSMLKRGQKLNKGKPSATGMQRRRNTRGKEGSPVHDFLNRLRPESTKRSFKEGLQEAGASIGDEIGIIASPLGPLVRRSKFYKDSKVREAADKVQKQNRATQELTDRIHRVLGENE